MADRIEVRENDVSGEGGPMVPPARRTVASEQICLLPVRLTWQWTLIQASTRFSFAPGSARHNGATGMVFGDREMIFVLIGRDSGASL